MRFGDVGFGLCQAEDVPDPDTSMGAYWRAVARRPDLYIRVPAAILIGLVLWVEDGPAWPILMLVLALFLEVGVLYPRWRRRLRQRRR